MLFNSFEFLIFLPIVITGYYSIPHRYRWAWLLSASYYFYMAHEPELLVLLIISTLVDYFCGIKIFKASKKSIKRNYLILSIITNVGILISFKYLFFFTSNLQSIFDFFGVSLISAEETSSYNFSNILLPVGISFYTFQTMSYSIEIYRGVIKPEKHLGKFALYVAFFPQLVAGPIERASRLLPQIKSKTPLSIKNMQQGIIVAAWGFFLKLVVADRLGVYVDAAFSTPDSPHNLALMLGSIFFCFQIYYDFSAYTSIAIGVAKIMGFDLIQNFNRPIFATSIAEFWKRWHISFTTWLRDFIYIPLVKRKKISRLLAVSIVFFVNGLWHGANWTFVIWSLLNALILVCEISSNKIRSKIFDYLGFSKRLRGLTGWFTGISLIILTLVFFRSPNVSHALSYLKHMFNFGSLHFNIINNYFEIFLSIVLILFTQYVFYKKGNDKIYELFINKNTYTKYALSLTYIIIMVLFAINRQNSFIYFQF
ncbi:MBOAT family O-acyltransferase [Hyunsoonleella ulvae]|uniref:MBOAT family O-acyltransferase n=1 Tax=Hyunsoonleella ulvae TaxID=2799948 RepID=UPI001939B2DD|nr:MBOAT family protein [Hyunsoonleella ulvae]